MKIQKIHPNLIVPQKGSIGAGAYDVYMPNSGIANGISQFFGLGFASAVPPGYLAILQPRSSTGAKHGVELNNTMGWIDSDYRGEWKAAIRTKDGREFSWEAGERLLQFALVPVFSPGLELVEELEATDRGFGGFGSSGR